MISKLGVVLWPSDILSQVSKETTIEEAKALLPKMWDVVEKAPAVGLAAVQLGNPIRLFVMDSRSEWKQRYAFMNPEIVEFIGEPVLVEEGCVSIPGYYEKVLRYPEVVIRATNIERETEPRLFSLYGLEAQIAAHEIEHLDGKLALVDNKGVAARDIVKRKIKKYLRNNG